MAVINMSKANGNTKINMVKDDGSTMRIAFIGVSWNKNRYAGEANFDLDLCGFLTDGNRKVQYPTEIVNYNTYKDGSAYPWVKFSGDNQTGENNASGIDFGDQHYDEYFVVDLTKFPADKTEFSICASIYRAVQRVQNFGMVESAVLTICDYENPNGDRYVYDLSEEANFEKLNAVEIGRLYRYNGGFKFQAIGSGYMGGMTELFKNFGLDIDEGRD